MKLKSLGVLFALLFSQNFLRAQCAGQSTYTVSPLPSANGTYPPNTTVTVCFTMVGYTQTNANWVDGFEVQLGPGWVVSSLTPTVPPATQGGGAGQWLWRTTVVGSNTGNTNGPGFFFDLNNDGNPGNDFGDNSSTGTWTFCFTVQTGTTPGATLSIGIDVLSDSEIGSWSTTNLCGGPPVIAVPSSTTIAAAPCSVTAGYTGSRCQGASGTLNTSTFAGATTYSWSGPNAFSSTQQNPSLGPLAAASSGTYNVTVSSGTCTATSSVVVNVVSPAQITMTAGNVTCFGLTNGSVAAAVVPARPYTYAWSGTTQTTATISNLAAGVYNLTVTDTSGCTATASATVVQPAAALNAQAGNDTVIVNGGIAQIGGSPTASGGTGPYTYSWTPAASVTNATAANTSASPAFTTNYVVCVTDSNSCTDCDTARVRVIFGPLAEAFVLNQGGIITFPDSIRLCPGSSLTLGGSPTGSLGTPPYRYLWTPSTGLSSDTVPNPVLTNATSSANYVVTVTDSAGLIGRDTIRVIVPAALSLSVINTPVSCFGLSTGALDLTVSGGFTPFSYSWNTGSVNQDLSGLPLGNYSVTVTDANQCSTSGSYTISQPVAPLAVGPGNITAVSCFGGSDGAVSVNPNGGTSPYSYVWSNSQFNSGIVNVVAGTYRVTVSDNRGCRDSAQFTITQPATAVQVDSVTSRPVRCFGQADGSLAVFASGGSPTYTYLWSNNATTSAVSSQPAGSYAVTVTDRNGCTASGNTLITQPALAVGFNPPVITDARCFGASDGAITVSGNGGVAPYTYLWFNGNTSTTVNGLAAGNYSVTVTDANLCTATATYTINAPVSLVLSPVVTDLLCYGASTGSIDANPSGATSPYQFIWSDGQTSQTAINLVQGTYSLTATDANGCTASASATLNQPDSLSISATATRVACLGISDGTISITASGGNLPYIYRIVPLGGATQSQSTSSFTGLSAGQYTYSFIDANNCSRQAQIIVPEALADSIVVETDSATCYRLSDGVIRVYGLTSFNSVYRYGLDNGPLQFGNDFTGISAGLHSLLVVNAFGCETRIPVIMTEPQPIIAEVNPDTISIGLGDAQGVVVQVANIDSNQVDFIWSPREGLSCFDCFNPIVSPYRETEYTVTVSQRRRDGLRCQTEAKLLALVAEAQPTFVPNTFSPNGDGVNDEFLVYGNDIKSISMKIFNRWGEKVFESTNQKFGWNGKYRGEDAVTGVYTYYVQIRTLDDKESMQQGTINLIR